MSDAITKPTIDLPCLQEINFMFASHPYCANLVSIQNFQEEKTAFGVASMPLYIKGSIEIEGWEVPVMDIHQYCGLKGIPQTIEHVAVLELHDMALTYFMKDVTAHLLDVKQSKGVEHVIEIDTLVGIAIVRDKMVVLMDAEKLIEKDVLYQDVLKDLDI